LCTRETVGVGFTTILKVIVAPSQLTAEGVTTMVAVTGAELVLVAVNDAILPEPLAAIPIEGVSFVQV